MAPDEVRSALRRMSPWVCEAGAHVEISSVDRCVDFGGFEIVETDAPESDESFVARMRHDFGDDNVFAVSTSNPLGLPPLPGGLEHIGFGDFAKDDAVFVRDSTPSGDRIYIRRKRVARYEAVCR